MNELIDDLIEMHVCLPLAAKWSGHPVPCPLHLIIYPPLRPRDVIREVYQRYSALFQAIDKNV